MSTFPFLTPVEEALSQMLAEVSPLMETELIPVTQLLGRVLAEDILAPLDVPPADHSAMDGYAVRVAETAVELPVSQRITAGQVPQPLAAQSCARIMTGGLIPPGADAVVMQEWVAFDEEDKVLMLGKIEPGQNIRRRGQDMQLGQRVLSRGQLLDARHQGLLASLGLAEVPVMRRVRVALLATGDELAMPGQALQPGQIYNSNRPLLMGWLAQQGVEVIDLGQVADTAVATEAALQMGAEQADLILSTGGVSVGEEDHVKPAVEKLGQLQLWKLAMKPGKPVAFGRIPRAQGQAEAVFLGLPGNPVSVFVGAEVLLKPLLARLAGRPPATPRLLTGRADFDWHTQLRQEYLRVRAEPSAEGWQLSAHPNQNSGVLSSVTWANALACVPPHTRLQAGQALAFWFIDEPFFDQG
ncbi:gephyrin-like molybdotransferase Glp [Marinospirillum sp. MEB164]|uniref:Molybdopterin molybdenumtransferase n=1 Tax=Marinospirillum alkalitolerans TaxID=3123374 RepID=A0ABW8Q0R4_9GAMM